MPLMIQFTLVGLLLGNANIYRVASEGALCDFNLLTFIFLDSYLDEFHEFSGFLLYQLVNSGLS